MGQREEPRPERLDVRGILTAQQRGQILADQSRDRGPVLAVVPVVDLADEPVVGAQAGDHGGALDHRVGAAAEVPAQGDVDRDGFQTLDAHAARPRPDVGM